MKRIKLLALMAVLFAALAAVVVYGSPYAPVVAPVMDIEEIWAIEDAREESDVPLVTALENHGMRLGYDETENTFYCPIGMETGDEWPELHLTAPGAKGVQLCFVDDYSYDWCSDALRDSYAYQIMAYTDTEFAYSQIVFTGLPVVTLNAAGEIPVHEDVQAEVAVSWPGEEALVLNGRTHRRGANSLRLTQKHGFKVEFVRSRDGGRVQAQVPFLGMTDDMTLIACALDPLMIRDRLSWDLYNAFMDDREAFADLDMRYVELFVNDEYYGVYLMMKPYDYAAEMEKESAMAALQDSYYRTAKGAILEAERPVIMDHLGNSCEQFYAPAGETDFQSLRPYLELIALKDDAAFSRGVLERLDLDSVIRYVLFVQACALTDNEYNNVGIWAHRENGGIKYHYVPWDLDMSWSIDRRDAEYWYAYDLFDRMLRLNCGGVVRARTLEIWQELRGKAFNQDNLDVLMARYDEALNASGAYYRDSLRWESHGEALDTYGTYAYALDRFDMMDRRIAEMAAEAYKDRQIAMEGYEIQDVGALDARLMGLDM